MKNKNCPYCTGNIIPEKKVAFCENCGEAFLIFFLPDGKLFYLQEVNVNDLTYYRLVYEPLKIDRLIKIQMLIEKGIFFLTKAPDYIKELLLKEFQSSLFKKYFEQVKIDGLNINVETNYVRIGINGNCNICYDFERICDIINTKTRFDISGTYISHLTYHKDINQIDIL